MWGVLNQGTLVLQNLWPVEVRLWRCALQLITSVTPLDLSHFWKSLSLHYFILCTLIIDSIRIIISLAPGHFAAWRLVLYNFCLLESCDDCILAKEMSHRQKSLSRQYMTVMPVWRSWRHWSSVLLETRIFRIGISYSWRSRLCRVAVRCDDFLMHACWQLTFWSRESWPCSHIIFLNNWSSTC